MVVSQGQKGPHIKLLITLTWVPIRNVVTLESTFIRGRCYPPSPQGRIWKSKLLSLGHNWLALNNDPKLDKQDDSNVKYEFNLQNEKILREGPTVGTLPRSREWRPNWSRLSGSTTVMNPVTSSMLLRTTTPQHQTKNDDIKTSELITTPNF